MAVTAFVIGFFTAFGWWTAGKITTRVDQLNKPVIESPIKEVK